MSRSRVALPIWSALVATIVFASGCVIDSAAPIPGEYCLIAGPIGFSDSDTAATKREIDKHNAKWQCVCEQICD